MDKIKLLIVDDHAVVRQGLRGFLELTDEFDVVGEGANGLEAVSLAQELQPDVILMDLIMPEMDGIEATRRIKLANLDMKILILSSFGDENNVLPAIQAGALGYILKDIDPEELADAIRKTAQGKTQLDPEIANLLISHMQNDSKNNEQVNQKLSELTSRELEVLVQIGRGLSNKEIATELSISQMTVKTHVSNILSKLNLADRTQAAIFSIRQGLVPED
ncbi:response regulator transcription factor [Candidatus Bathyarchaeota archaeon]|nr:response regulator transcription factor [Candidatus Bathyarchaeota archaeon]